MLARLAIGSTLVWATSACVSNSSGLPSVPERTTIDQITTTTRPQSLFFTGTACNGARDEVAFSITPKVLDASCESGWAQVRADTPDGRLRVLLSLTDNQWQVRAQRPEGESFATAELLSMGAPEPVARALGASRPWIIQANQLEVTRLMSSNRDFHDAIVDPCSLATVLALDLATRSFAMVTDNSDQCTMTGPRTLLIVEQGSTMLRAVRNAGDSGSPSAQAFDQALARYSGVESVDLIICGDPIDGDLCVSEIRPTPVSRRP